MQTDVPPLEELINGPAVITVPAAGRYLGLGRSASYDAARRGVIPTILVGEVRRVVPAAALAKVLGV
jgi:hypothetical protein